VAQFVSTLHVNQTTTRIEEHHRLCTAMASSFNLANW